MDSSTGVKICNFQFSGDDDDLIEAIELWRLTLPEAVAVFREMPPDERPRVSIGEPEPIRTTRGTVVKIEMTVVVDLLRRSRLTNGTRSSGRLELPEVTVHRSGSITFPDVLESECRALADQLSRWGVTRTDGQSTETRTGGSPGAGNPGRRAHARARERLTNGENEDTVRTDWCKDYEDETGMAPKDTTSGEKELWRNVKRGNK